ncbi:MAG TPA: PAS domain S-box protein, partial [Coleofasciculaceae cyanobacterium]
IRDAAGKPQYLLAIAEDITERKQAASEAVRNAAALAESEQKYRDLVETSQDIIWSVDNRGCITFVNQAVKQILGYEPEEMLGHPFADFAAPEQLTLDLKGLQYVLNGESVLGYEAIYLAKDGRPIHLLRNAIPKRDSQGRVIGATGTASDITTRKQVEEALRQQLKQQQLVKAIAARIRSSLHLEDVLKTTVEQVREFLQTDRTIVYRFRPDWSGDVVVESVGEGWVKSIGQNIHDPCFGENMVVPYQHGHITNIEDIYTAGLEQCFINLLEHYQVRADCVVPILLQSGDEMNSEERSVPVLWGLLVAHHCRSPRQWHESEIESLRQLSVQLAIAIQQSTLFEQAQAEIADRKRAEAALEAAKEAAEVANRSKSIFLANMSHELRTPLNVILGFTQLINRDSSLSSEQREHLDIIMRSGEHLLELIDDILEMSKIEAGRITLNETSFDLYRLLDSLQEMFQLKAQSKGLQLIFERTNAVPQYVQADEGKLRQVLINLLSNALKFTEHGSVALRVVRKLNVESFNLQPTNLAYPSRRATPNGNGYAEQPANLQPITLTFEVSDTGPGIVPEEIDLLFDTFTQTTTGLTANEGTGLGLPISRSFVQLMGGELTVNSTLGQGTTFRFDIPLQFSRSSDMQPTQSAGRVIGLAPGQEKYRILVVEDQWASRQLLVKLLSSIGFEVNAAENGQEAVALWSSWQPHLIFMDMRMPVMDGYEATRQIKARERVKMNVETAWQGQQEIFPLISSSPKSKSEKAHVTAIIALTASAFEEQRAAVLSIGCDDFIRKPFREEILLEKIATYLGVRYIYEDSSYIPTLRTAQRVELTTDEALTVMPKEWIAQLHKLAESCNDEEILVLLDQIPAEHESLKLSLQDLVKDFQLDIILDLTGI